MWYKKGNWAPSSFIVFCFFLVTKKWTGFSYYTLLSGHVLLPQSYSNGVKQPRTENSEAISQNKHFLLLSWLSQVFFLSNWKLTNLKGENRKIQDLILRDYNYKRRQCSNISFYCSISLTILDCLHSLCLTLYFSRITVVHAENATSWGKGGTDCNSLNSLPYVPYKQCVFQHVCPVRHKTQCRLISAVHQLQCKWSVHRWDSNCPGQIFWALGWAHCDS
jgi:hypothetical protein